MVDRIGFLRLDAVDIGTGLLMDKVCEIFRTASDGFLIIPFRIGKIDNSDFAVFR